MDATGLAVAVVAVFGTLLSPVVTQRLSERARQKEFELQRAHRTEDHVYERQQAQYEQKRACYVAMTATSRRYRIELMNYLYATVGRGADVAAPSALRMAREAYIASVAETHMTATAPVLAALESVTSNLSNAFRLIKRMEDGEPDPDWSFERIEAFLVELWNQWVVLRQVMRADLGVED